MTLQWHKKDPSALVRLRQDVDARYPDVCVLIIDDSVHLKGGFPIIEKGVELDRFQLDIEIPGDFPKNIPITKEIAGRIPIKPDWHAFGDDKSLCVIVPEEWLINPQSGSVIAFIDGPLRNFLIAHALAEAGQKRPMGERPHGGAGLIEAYGEMLDSGDPRATEQYLLYLAKKKFKGHWNCPCGSMKKLRNCHLAKVYQLQQRIPRYVAKMALKRLHHNTKGRFGAVVK
jgi:hypothetical protein